MRLLPGLVPIVADSTEAALRAQERLNGHPDEESLLREFAAAHGLPADPDAVLTVDRFPVDPDRQQPVGFARSLHEVVATERITLRQLARRVEGGHRLVLGTPAEVAEQILDWWRAGVVDGFTVQPPSLPGDLRVFVDEVIPLLRAAGAFPSTYTESTVRARFGLPRVAVRAER
nr:hypothetical protein [Nocardia takedensis]